MSDADIFFYETFDEERKAIEKALSKDIRAQYSAKTIAETDHTEPPARFISVRTQSSIPPPWPSQLRAILTRSTGYDHLAAYRDDVACGYLPAYCAEAVAEHAALMWMSLLRRLPQQLEHFRTFNRDYLTGSESAGKTLLIVGVGRIGHAVHALGTRLGMRVLGVDLDEKHTDVTYVRIEQGLKEADVVVCAMNLNETNRGYFSATRLGAVKQGAVFVNVARGELVSPSDLLESYRSGQLSGIALDVFDEEADLASSLRSGAAPTTESARVTLELAAMPNVMLTPHNAFNSVEALSRKAGQTVEQVERFLACGAFDWPVP